MTFRSTTQRQIASACGVNVSTVSRALSNHPGVSEATRKIVKARAEQLGWKPNPLALAYMAHVRSTRAPSLRASIAWLICSSTNSIDDLAEFYRKVITGAKVRAISLGYTLEIVWMKDIGFDPRRLRKLLRNRGIPGVVVWTPDFSDLHLAGFDWKEFALVAWGCQPQWPHPYCALSDAFHGMQLIIEKIKCYGYRNPALVLTPLQDELSNHTFFAAFYYEERIGTGLERFLSLRLPDNINESERVNMAAKWLRKHRPELVIGDQAAWEAIKQLKWKVPRDIAFISPCWSNTWPQIAGLDQRPEIIGVNVIDLMAAQLMHNERGLPITPSIVLNKGCWRDGASFPRKG